MDIAKAGEASSATDEMSRQSVCTTVTAASYQWELIEHGQILRRETSDSASTPGYDTSQMERTVRQPECMVVQLQTPINRTARMIEANAVCGEMQWLARRAWLEDRQRNWDGDRKDDVMGQTISQTWQRMYWPDEKWAKLHHTSTQDRM